MATDNKVTNVGEGTKEWWKEWGTGLDNLNQAKWDPSSLYREQEIAQQSLSNQMLSNQSTALDTIRKANASAIASGANAGLSAANQLSSVLGLQQETAQASTELANRHITEAISGEQAALENFRELLNTGAAMLQSEAAMGDVQSKNLAYTVEGLDKRISEAKTASERALLEQERDVMLKDIASQGSGLSEGEEAERNLLVVKNSMNRSLITDLDNFVEETYPRLFRKAALPDATKDRIYERASELLSLRVDKALRDELPIESIITLRKELISELRDAPGTSATKNRHDQYLKKEIEKLKGE